ncbi:Peptidase propeptide and YPEB domain protein [Tepidimonas alkaliphilus]|uniref:Peptidase propeptide and YPEB domain protein n=1 Tax=Tepidimonas alkaliphilus TaxID=2588942 RepID=A0A554WBK9_9BURK|nr:PepSY domain-containing protein [Tepidimonas alkaliphilus]TSE20960.1 Peptidase propeptide and YPEB domain protein [Tepidimonas alkaliphilus]
MRQIFLGITVALASLGAAWASPQCKAPKEQWMKEADFRAMVEKRGYQIKTFKVSSGQCYEIYGRDAAGKKVEIYFDPATGAELQRK